MEVAGLHIEDGSFVVSGVVSVMNLSVLICLRLKVYLNDISF